MENNRYYKECDAEGISWKPPVVCSDGKVCSNNQCIEKLCSSGEKKCDENGNVIVCNTDSLSWSVLQECEGSAVCKRGNCVEGNVCNPGEKKCYEGNGNYFQVCDEWGTAWLNPVSCGAGSICNAGECLDIVCIPGSLKCSNDMEMKNIGFVILVEPNIPMN